MQRVIGIDFGTSTTYMNVKRYSGAQPDGDRFSYIPVVFNYGESSGYVATIVRENADGSFDFGEKAAEALDGAKIHTEVKMRLESPDEAQRLEARRITKEFFKFLRATYVQQAGNLGGADDEEETVVSYPVKWRAETAQFMLDAAREAGFRNVRGMDEAQAAVTAVLCQNGSGKGLIYADKPGYLLLIDMGAGTTDLVVCRYRASESGVEMELVSSWPQSEDEPTFGGREIDKTLEKYVEEYLESSLNPALAPQAHIIASAPGQAKMWKERNVSVTLAADKAVSTCAYIGTYRSMGMLDREFPSFDRRKFESCMKSGLDDYVRLVKGCLDETVRTDEGFAEAGLDVAILTGGHSAWYFARDILTGAMEGWLEHPALARIRENPYRAVSLPNPQITVSLGLVYSRLPVQLRQKIGQKRPVDGAAQENPGAQTAENKESDAKTETAVCPACRFENKPGANFCTRCGASLKGKAEKKSALPHPSEQDKLYCRKAREYLDAAGYRCEESMEEDVRKSLEIPKEERMLWCSSHAEKGMYEKCALTESGLSLKFAEAGSLRRMSWTEFAAFSWTRDFFTDFKLDTASVLIARFSGTMLEEIHICLHGPSEEPKAKQVGKSDEKTEQEQPKEEKADEKPYVFIDRSKCQSCGAPIPEGAAKCPICGRRTRMPPVLPFKVGLMSWYIGKVKLGVAKATGGMTIHADRVEFRRHMGNAAAVLTPYTLIYSAVKANVQPKDVYWMKDIADARKGSYAMGIPSLILTMKAGEVYTFSAAFNTQGTQDAVEDAVELIQMMIRRE